MVKKFLIAVTTVILLLFLLTDPVHATAASASGLLLWYNSLVPVLLPFFILSSLLIAADSVSMLTAFLYPVLHRLFGCSRNGCFCLTVGFLCGFPTGARTAADLIREKRISLEEGSYLTGFCNNVSPAFLTGFCLTESLRRPDLLRPSLLIVFGVPVLVGIVTRKRRIFPELPAKEKTSGSQISFKIVDVCIMNGLESILKLGCYIILFSMLSALFNRLPLPCPALPALLSALLEMTNGIQVLTSCASIPDLLLWPLVLGTAAFGGLSGAAQVQGMTVESGISLSSYLKKKAVTALLVFLSALLFSLFILPQARQALPR